MLVHADEGGVYGSPSVIGVEESVKPPKVRFYLVHDAPKITTFRAAATPARSLAKAPDHRYCFINYNRGPAAVSILAVQGSLFYVTSCNLLCV